MQLKKITITNIWHSTPISTFDALSKWHEPDIRLNWALEKEDADTWGQRWQFEVQLRQAPKIIALAIKKCYGDKFGTNALCVQSWHKKKSSDKTAIMSQESREHTLYRCTTNRTFDNTHWNATTARFKVHIFCEGHKNMTKSSNFFWRYYVISNLEISSNSQNTWTLQIHNFVQSSIHLSSSYFLP